MTKVLAMTTTQLKEKNKMLEQQKEELKKFDQLKSEFVSIVSHELRTPMSIIKGSLSQLLDVGAHTSKEVAEKLLAISLKNVNRLTHLVNNLLDLSKIEAGKIELHKEVVDLVVIVKEVCHSFMTPAKEKNIEMREWFSSDSIMINIDKDKIIQVLINLIGNSMKFVEKGFVKISIMENQEVVVCTVEDSGKGIAVEDLPKVFGKFKQFGQQDSGVKGTGLGLSISKGLVELHKGKIWVESALGVGTKFIFELPKNS
jgi:signal transduction histidine kinase